ncbi:MAG TPA: U-box domain-containing protein [Parachlamydiaceae bacterium]|nr:U-box domain-containing protein [Parachlamydiaceae bacterium]
MSMNIQPPTSRGAGADRDFVLETNSQNHPVLNSGIVELSVPTLHSSKYSEAVRVDRERRVNYALNLTVGSMVTGALKNGIMYGVISAIAMAIIMLGLNKTYEHLSPNYRNFNPVYLPTNAAKLAENIFQIAKKNKEIPNKFKDPITLETIESPVSFIGDPSATIYDLKTVQNFEAKKITQNPIVRNLNLDFQKLVYLPEVKKQIDEINELLEEDGM